MSARQRNYTLVNDKTADCALRELCPSDLEAIVEGRFFADRQRVRSPEQRLLRGQTITVYAKRGSSTAVSHDPKPQILGERQGILALAKPADWSSEPDKTGNAKCLIRYVVEQLGRKEAHVATRLDVGVSGITLVATHAPSRRHLMQLIERGQLHRSYVAICTGLLPHAGRFTGAVETKPGEKAREAVTNFERISHLVLPPESRLGAVAPPCSVSLVRFRPETGRRHQLRIHSSRNGHPLLGDRRYGGPKQYVSPNGSVIELSRIMLTAVATHVPLPDGEVWSVHCPIDEEVGGFWELLGGNYDDFKE